MIKINLNIIILLYKGTVNDTTTDPLTYRCSLCTTFIPNCDLCNTKTQCYKCKTTGNTYLKDDQTGCVNSCTNDYYGSYCISINFSKFLFIIINSMKIFH